MQAQKVISTLDQTRPILIAGATASGKSDLALKIVAELGGVIVNADALQVYSGWRILTARPNAQEEATAPHRLYGYVPNQASYSVGDWLRDIGPILSSGQRPIVVGGTGLYFSALTEGLANIPPISKAIRAQSADMLAAGHLSDMLDALDMHTKAKIDVQNPMRVSRAWEVEQETGQSLVDWHAQTPPPLVQLVSCDALHLASPVDWLNPRLALRFEMMIADGALEEARANLEHWDPDLQSSQAIGATEMIAYLRGYCGLDNAKELAVTASRQYAKRQRTWFRKRMQNWRSIASNLL